MPVLPLVVDDLGRDPWYLQVAWGTVPFVCTFAFAWLITRTRRGLRTWHVMVLVLIGYPALGSLVGTLFGPQARTDVAQGSAYVVLVCALAGLWLLLKDVGAWVRRRRARETS